MPYTTLVSGTTITASWANANVRDQVVTPFASASARTSAISSPVQGMLSYRTDLGSNGGLEFYSGSAWLPAGSQLIASSTLGGAAATVTFSSIPQQYNSLLLVGLGQATPAVNNNDNLIQISGDSAANYSMATWDASQAAANPAGSFTRANTSLIWGFALPGSSYASTRVGAFSVFWPGYSNTTLTKASLHDMFMTDSGTSWNSHKRWGYWNSTAAITSLLLTCGGSGNFTAGSYFALYGMP